MILSGFGIVIIKFNFSKLVSTDALMLWGVFIPVPCHVHNVNIPPPELND
jgi:hypothetical protein